ncbi:uncharacterized protein AMSG_00156 [Thecamonas trahens ATCC 50062]|uniref:Uncharacterized protein n=1 Tax=Thecamonas trahens ATCC 50062 TaxID=461836 RepID=A0A0L0D1B5_THETB|nr:hypothetical protein AMSG_00156 [Thecamonas trahens ATCC 50062]KNC46037.1 hypothetical protein AMSG_00156 [Thecamonas trahens ATCC 50062]|eukprot:XP_013763017.1 hypothetical protein AMSG_00156 [Thecamonas trahens ATCC 50062]
MLRMLAQTLGGESATADDPQVLDLVWVVEARLPLPGPKAQPPATHAFAVGLTAQLAESARWRSALRVHILIAAPPPDVDVAAIAAAWQVLLTDASHLGSQVKLTALVANPSCWRGSLALHPQLGKWPSCRVEAFAEDASSLRARLPRGSDSCLTIINRIAAPATVPWLFTGLHWRMAYVMPSSATLPHVAQLVDVLAADAATLVLRSTSGMLFAAVPHPGSLQLFGLVSPHALARLPVPLAPIVCSAASPIADPDSELWPEDRALAALLADAVEETEPPPLPRPNRLQIPPLTPRTKHQPASVAACFAPSGRVLPDPGLLGSRAVTSVFPALTGNERFDYAALARAQSAHTGRPHWAAVEAALAPAPGTHSDARQLHGVHYYGSAASRAGAYAAVMGDGIIHERGSLLRDVPETPRVPVRTPQATAAQPASRRQPSFRSMARKQVSAAQRATSKSSLALAMPDQRRPADINKARLRAAVLAELKSLLGKSHPMLKECYRKLYQVCRLFLGSLSSAVVAEAELAATVRRNCRTVVFQLVPMTDVIEAQTLQTSSSPAAQPVHPAPRPIVAPRLVRPAPTRKRRLVPPPQPRALRRRLLQTSSDDSSVTSPSGMPPRKGQVAQYAKVFTFDDSSEV